MPAPEFWTVTAGPQRMSKALEMPYSLPHVHISCSVQGMLDRKGVPQTKLTMKTNSCLAASLLHSLLRFNTGQDCTKPTDNVQATSAHMLF